MFEVLTRWRRERILRRSNLDESLWRAMLERYPFTRALSGEERARLREQVVLFLHEKSIVGAGGLKVRDEMRVCIAAQACMLILNLDLDYYRGWVEVIVYPDEFVAKYDYVDEDGIAHHVEEPMTGESWLEGPVILSWADAQLRGGDSGYNVVIHEFAHKLHMDGEGDEDFPAARSGMDTAKWRSALEESYRRFGRDIDTGRPTFIDPYAAEHPAEFFAVMSEAFFTESAVLARDWPGLYQQLALFYRQDPAGRAET